MNKFLLNLLKATQPILYEDNNEYWSYRYSGTCFPIKWKNSLFIVTAKHCYINMGMERPEQTSYPTLSNDREFFGYDSYFTIDKDYKKDEYKYTDLLALRVSGRLHEKDINNFPFALDISSLDNIIEPKNQTIEDIWIRGFLLENDTHEITEEKIIKQGYITNKPTNIRISRFDFCYWIKMTTPSPKNMSPNGLSGSPVYAITKDKKVKLCGILIEYNEYTKEFLSVSPSVLREMIKQSNAS